MCVSACAFMPSSESVLIWALGLGSIVCRPLHWRLKIPARDDHDKNNKHCNLTNTTICVQDMNIWDIWRSMISIDKNESARLNWINWINFRSGSKYAAHKWLTLIRYSWSSFLKRALLKTKLNQDNLKRVLEKCQILKDTESSSGGETNNLCRRTKVTSLPHLFVCYCATAFVNRNQKCSISTRVFLDFFRNNSFNVEGRAENFEKKYRGEKEKRRRWLQRRFWFRKWDRKQGKRCEGRQEGRQAAISRQIYLQAQASPR